MIKGFMITAKEEKGSNTIKQYLKEKRPMLFKMLAKEKLISKNPAILKTIFRIRVPNLPPSVKDQMKITYGSKDPNIALKNVAISGLKELGGKEEDFLIEVISDDK